MASFRPGSRAYARILVMAVVCVACAAIAWRARSASVEGRRSSIHAAVTAIDPHDFLHHIEVLSSDDFEGRSPGTHGEALTVSYLEQQFKSIGLMPGNPNGMYTQPVPMTGFTSHPQASITVGGRHIELHFHRISSPSLRYAARESRFHPPISSLSDMALSLRSTAGTTIRVSTFAARHS